MDEFATYDHARPTSTRSGRTRTSSINTVPSWPHASTSRVQPQDSKPTLRNRDSAASLRSMDSDVSEIIAPIPDRHFLQSHQSQQWLYSPSHSPTSSRAVSPTSQTFDHTTSGYSSRHLSFSTLMEHERPRRSSWSPAISRDEVKVKAKASSQGDHAMGKRWIRWMDKHGMKQWIVSTAIVASIWIKWGIGLGSYSGHNTPPMYGDYEAQRHWMELTIHLPMRQWYTYDLQYWGLDYPPLTAYVSWICGITGSRVNPTWFALDSSRGIETPDSTVFMRSTVLVLDALIYIPALLMFTKTWQDTRSKRTQNLALLTLLLQPALLLVDFGHFQYNSVMLGFTVLAVNFFAKGQDIFGAFFFVLSLGFKQMALYYAPAIGSYLLGKCIYLGFLQGARLFIRLGLVTSLTFVLLFLPFLPPFSPFPAILDPITRIFPFNRGLFEDKVANFWCASNVAFKWKHWASRDALVKLSTGLTAVGFLPSVIGLIQGSWKTRSMAIDKTAAPATTPTLPLLPFALLTSSMSFFLFSFQVHEKTILLPLLPMTLLLAGSSPESSVFAWGVLANNIGVFSMWPLLKRDGLVMQYIATLVLWNRLIGYNPFRLRKNSVVHLLSIAVYAACVILHILELLIPPPSRYPDIFPVLNVLISTPVFFLVWLWSIKCGVEIGWALGGLPGSSHPIKSNPSDNPPTNHERGDNRARRAGGIERETGGRAVSLGFAQGRRRGPYRPVSIGPDVR